MSDGLDQLHRAVAGDAAALAGLLEEHGPTVRGRLSGEIGRHWQASLDVDDVLQVTYFEAFLRISRFKPTSVTSFVNWLSQIADNNLRDAIRELQRAKRPDPRRRIVSTPQESATNLVAQLCEASTTPSLVMRREAAERLMSAIQQLPPDYQTVIRGCDLDQRTVAEVAREMGRSEGAVHMLRSRAHDALREILETSA